MAQQTLQELPDNYHNVAGTPDTALKKLQHIKDRLNIGHLIYYRQESRMAHDAAMRSIELFAKEVLPVVKTW